jgi:hypothetical protein
MFSLKYLLSLISKQQTKEVSQTNIKMAQSTDSQASSRLQIVHVTIGRLRLRTTDSSFNSVLDNIAQDLRSIEGVREVVVNEQTGSLVVNFIVNSRFAGEKCPCQACGNVSCSYL